MKQFYNLALLFTSLLAFAQPPAGYYNNATGTGYTLKSQLKTIITNGHTWNNNSYDNLYTIIYPNSDVDNYYEVDGTLLDIYTENPSGPETSYSIANNICGGMISAEGQCYNREHIFPQGFFNNNDSQPMVSDAHHVIPTDGFVNNGRSNYPFGVVTNVNTSYSNGSRWGTGNNFGYTGRVFEPIDEFKGDVARMLLYFAVRYEDDWNNMGWSSPSTQNNPLNGTSDQFYETWYVNLLLDWHNNDPVSQREQDRNDVIFQLQGNRNPFIDNPAYANAIWNPNPDNQAPTAPTNLVASNPTTNSIDLSWTASTDNIGVTSYDIFVDGVNTTSTSNTSITITVLAANTEFCFTVFAVDAALNTSMSSNQACETTLTGTTTTNELFISEYVEDGNNKAIEIANFTGAAVSLTDYTLARDVNSGGSFGTPLQLMGTIQNGDVFVIARGNAPSATIQSAADQLSSADAMSFNGDDPVGLFKGGTLLDVFGNVGGMDDFEDVVYRRKSSVAGPTTVFNLSGEWDMFPETSLENLGSHTQILNSNDFDLNEIKVFPNPAKSRITISLSNSDEAKVELYNILGNKVLTARVVDNQQIGLQHISSGVYLLKIEQAGRFTTKKLIID